MYDWESEQGAGSSAPPPGFVDAKGRRNEPVLGGAALALTFMCLFPVAVVLALIALIRSSSQVNKGIGYAWTVTGPDDGGVRL